MTPEQAAAIIGGRVVPDTELADASHCPTCGVATRRSTSGHPSLCLPCTEAEVGEYADELAARVSRKITRNAYAKLPRDRDGRPILPSLNYRQWRQLWR